MRRRVIAISALFLIFGCSDGEGPSRRDALQQISDRLDSVPSKYFAIKNLKYDNGFAKDPDDYVVSASYDLQFIMSLEDIKADYETRSGGVIANTDVVISILLVYKEANAGDTFSTEKNFLFTRSGTEWVLRGETT